MSDDQTTPQDSSEQDTVGGYAPVPPPESVKDGGSEAQEAAEAGAVEGAGAKDEDQDVEKGTGAADD